MTCCMYLTGFEPVLVMPHYDMTRLPKPTTLQVLYESHEWDLNPCSPPLCTWELS